MRLTISGFIDYMETVVQALVRIADALETIANAPRDQVVISGISPDPILPPAPTQEMHTDYNFPKWVDGKMTVVIEILEGGALFEPSNTEGPMILDKWVHNYPHGTIALVRNIWGVRVDGKNAFYEFIGVAGSAAYKGTYIQKRFTRKLSE